MCRNISSYLTKILSRWTADRLRGSSCLRDPMGWGRDGGNATYSYILPGSRQTRNPTLLVNMKNHGISENVTLTCYNWVKYWPKTKNNNINRECSARAIFSAVFSAKLYDASFGNAKGGRTPPPPYTGEGGKTRFTGEGQHVGYRNTSMNFYRHCP